GDPSRNPPLPSLIQILPVPTSVPPPVVILIEVNWLLSSKSSHGNAIKELCNEIFKLNHTFMAWGDVRKELKAFTEFNLFKLSNVVNRRNNQAEFRRYYNYSSTPSRMFKSRRY
ncbi:unnamed protein product, partial [Didymodactylos carnosus]